MSAQQKPEPAIEQRGRKATAHHLARSGWPVGTDAVSDKPTGPAQADRP